jgi:hypothetical protein
MWIAVHLPRRLQLKNREGKCSRIYSKPHCLHSNDVWGGMKINAVNPGGFTVNTESWNATTTRLRLVAHDKKAPQGPQGGIKKETTTCLRLVAHVSSFRVHRTNISSDFVNHPREEVALTPSSSSYHGRRSMHIEDAHCMERCGAERGY